MTTDTQDGDVVAWEVEVDSMNTIVFAATKPKARWIAGLLGGWIWSRPRQLAAWRARVAMRAARQEPASR